jgi:peptidoglycan lytic transglycosylase G
MKWVVALAAGLFLTACSAPAGAPCGTGGPACVTITIPRGATLKAAVDTLVANGLVRRRGWFSLYARLHGLGAGLKSGVYEFPRQARWSALIRDLKLGRGALIRFTVPEGLMLTEVADLARDQLGVPRDSFLAASQDPVLLRDLGIYAVAASVEGYLYPTTYTVRPDLTGRELVDLMVEEFAAHWAPAWQARLDTLGMTRYQIVTLASIVQAEVRYGPDRPYVSAVYHNRLARGMLLQADPTVVYAKGRRVRRVYEKDLLIHSPYNTYLHAGLPPGPICQPDSASLAAALYPATAPFLYFVAQPDGKHIFSVTYREHLAAIREVRQMQTGGSGRRTRNR